jgi:glycosyltransferase involved in cell wall biosynthesis
MNLLYTSTSYPPAIGGAQLYFHALAKAFAERNDVRVVTHWDTNRVDWLLGTTLRAPSVTDDYRIDNVPVHRIAFSFTKGLGVCRAVFLSYLPEMGDAMASGSAYSKLEVAAPCADLVHNNRIGREPLTLASLNFAHEHQIPFVFTPYHHPRWTGWRYRVYLDLYRQADALIALTEAEKNTYIDLGVDETRIHVVGAPGYLSSQVDGNTFRQMYNLGDNPIVLFVGQNTLTKE